MPYGRKFRGGELILATVVNAPSNFTATRSRRRKRKTRANRAVRHGKRKSRKSSARRKSGIKYTKRGQPYIILANGRARFIKGKRR